MASTPLATAPLRTVQNPQNSDNLNQSSLHNDTHLKPMQQAGDRNPVLRHTLEQPYQAGLNNQQQRQQSLYYLNQQQQHQQHQQHHALGQGLSGPQNANSTPPHYHEASSKPVLQNLFPPTSFAPVQSNHNQNHRPPPLSLPHHISNSSGGSSAFSSAKDIQQRPPSSPTKSLSDHLPFSHPNFQHHFSHPSHQQQLTSMPAVSASHRQGDQRPHIPQGQPPQLQTASQGQHQISQAPHRSLSSSSSNAPLRFQQNQQHHQQQQDNPIGISHQPAPVRLLGAPGNRGRSAETVDKSRTGGQGSNYQRSGPGGPPHPQHSVSYRNVGSNLISHNQPKPRGPDDALPYEKRGMLSDRDPGPRNPSSLDSSPYGHMAYTQDGLKPTGFRAYPPQPSLLPSQSAPTWGMGPRPTNATDRAGLNPGQPPPPNSHRGNPSFIQPNIAAPPVQSKGVHGKKIQEQEWRQTYLDDSDTL